MGWLLLRSSPVTLDAPILSLVESSPTNDQRPAFNIDFLETALPEVGSSIQYYVDGSSHGTPITFTEGNIMDGDPLDRIATLSGGVKNVRVRLQTGSARSGLSNTVAVDIDLVAPTLTSPAGSNPGNTTADLSVSTNEDTGTLYWVVAGSELDDPDADQVIAGLGGDGNAARDSGSQAVTTTGAQNITGGASDLLINTGYKVHFVQVDAATNVSDVSSSAEFSTLNNGITGVWVNKEHLTADGTTYDFTSRTYDAGVLVVGTASRGATTPDIVSVTLHVPDVASDPTGTSIPIHYKARNTGGAGYSITTLGVLDLPSNTTGVIRVIYNETVNRCGLYWGKATNCTTTPVGGGAGTKANPSVLDLECPYNGAIFSIVSNGAYTSVTWGGGMSQGIAMATIEGPLAAGTGICLTPGTDTRSATFAGLNNEVCATFLVLGSA